MHVVQKAGRNAGHSPQTVEIHIWMCGKWTAHESGQVDGTEVATTVSGQGQLSARVGGRNALAIPEVVAAVDAVDEQDTGLGGGMLRLHDLVPQATRRNAPMHPAQLRRCVPGPNPFAHFTA